MVARQHIGRSDVAALTARLDYLGPAEIEQVRKAYRFADEAHLGQFRASGEPYITHPLAVTTILAELGMNEATQPSERATSSST